MVNLNKKQFMIEKWHTDDILSVRDDLTIKQANDVLESFINRDHSSDFETIMYIAEDLYPSE